MIKFGLKFDALKLTLDEARLRQRLETRAESALGRVGAILRQEARKSIKRRTVGAGNYQRLTAARERGDASAARRIRETIARRQATVSAPGDPPIAHVPDHPVASIRAVYFSMASPREVVIGPVAGNSAAFAASNATAQTLPELVEFGGAVTVEESRRKRSREPWGPARVGRKKPDWVETRRRRTPYAARPFMGPTLNRSQALARRILESSFRGA